MEGVLVVACKRCVTLMVPELTKTILERKMNEVVETELELYRKPSLIQVAMCTGSSSCGDPGSCEGRDGRRPPEAVRCF